MPSIRHEVVIEATTNSVFDALTTSEGLSGWWTPGVTATAEAGSIARFPFGANYFKEMRITELIPPRRVQWHCIAGVDEWVGTTLSFNLTSGTRDSLLSAFPETEDQLEQLQGRDGLAILSFSHDGWKADSPMRAECNYTWGRFLRSLKLLCETGVGQPWPTQHRIAR